MLSNPAAPKDCTGSRVLACLAVATAAAGFLWVYSAAAHREPVIFPGKIAHAEQQEPKPALVVTSQTQSPSISEPASLTKLPQPDLQQNKGHAKPNKAAVASKSRRTRVVNKRVPTETRAAFALEARSTFAQPF